MPPAAPKLEMLAGAAPTGGAGIDGTGADARFGFATGIAVDAGGVLYVADSGAFAIRKITASGVVTTFAGTLGAAGFADGAGAAARFQAIDSLAMDAAGIIYVTDTGNNRIRKITPQGVVSTLAGGDSAGSADGAGSDARFEAPVAIAADAQGNLYVSEQFKPRIRKITPAGFTTTIAGSAEAGKVDGPAASARFGKITGLAVDASGNLLIADSGNHAIRKLGIDGNVTTLPGIGITTAVVAIDDAGILYVGDIGLLGNGGVVRILPSGEITSLSDGARVQGIAVAKDGRVYYTERGAVYRVSAPGAVTSLAGEVFGLQSQVDGIGASARFQSLTAIAANPAGDLHVVDGGGIRKVTRDGTVTTRSPPLTDTGTVGLAADDADASYYSLWNYCGGSPPGCAAHSTIEKLTADGQRVPIVPTGSSDGSPLYASLMMGLTRDSGGTLYFSQNPDGRIMKQDAGGNVTTIAGGVNGYADGVGTAARFSSPTALALDRSGNLYVADSYNGAIRKIAPDRTVTTLASGLYSPYGVAVDDAGNVYVADTGNHVVRKVTPSGNMSILAGQLGQAGFAAGALPGLVESPMSVAVVGNTLYIAMRRGIAVVRNLQ